MLDKMKNNIESYLLILVSIVLFILNSFGFEKVFGIPIDETTLLTLILTMLSVIYYKLIDINTNEINNKLTDTNIKFDDLLTISKGKVSAIEPKKEPHIWRNFVGDFYAINAPWKLEENIDLGYDEIIDEYIKEYANEKINNVYYIFYTNSNYPKAIERFLKFSKTVIRKSNIVKEKIKVIIVDGQAPEHSLFFGYKSNFTEHEKINKESSTNTYSYSVIYMGDKPFINKNGMPSWSFISVDKSLNNVLESYVQQLVHETEDILSISEFIKIYDKN